MGRGEDVDVRLRDPGASARHCRLHVEGGRVAIEDLGSRNGTQIRGQRIEAGERATLAAGESALVAGAVLLLQRKNRQLQQRRSLPHGYFELRLSEECLLAREGGQTTFSIARIDVEGGPDAGSFAATATQLLRPSDILGTYAPDAYEVLFPRTAPAEAEAALEPLLGKLDELGAEPRAAFAHFPADGRTAYALIERACARLRPVPASSAPPGAIVRHPRMREVYRLAEKAAGRDINVLILGETGVGKEILAQTIHRASKRADRPFLSLNCGGVSESLRESELFGYERGAFTDAKTAKPGLLETAEGGTVFLDEIGEMSPSIQAMLLRAIETKQITRIGGVRPKAIDVRFVAATNRDLVQEIREKRFRSDLYYRLNQISLEIPAAARAALRDPSPGRGIPRRAAGGAAGAPRLSDEAVRLLESPRLGRQHSRAAQRDEPGAGPVRRRRDRARAPAAGDDPRIDDARSRAGRRGNRGRLGGSRTVAGRAIADAGPARGTRPHRRGAAGRGRQPVARRPSARHVAQHAHHAPG